MGMALVLFGGGGILALALIVLGLIYKKKLLTGLGLAILAYFVALFAFN